MSKRKRTTQDSKTADEWIGLCAFGGIEYINKYNELLKRVAKGKAQNNSGLNGFAQARKAPLTITRDELIKDFGVEYVEMMGVEA